MSYACAHCAEGAGSGVSEDDVMEMMSSESGAQFLSLCGEDLGGARRKRDVLEAQRGGTRHRPDEEREAGSVIWRIIPAERASGNTHLEVICTHLDVGKNARGRSLTLTLRSAERWVQHHASRCRRSCSPSGLLHHRVRWPRLTFVFTRLWTVVSRVWWCLFGQCRRATIGWRFPTSLLHHSHPL